MVLICLESLTTTNIISIGGILVTAFVGIWIGISFKKSYETNKALKDYFISQATSIHNDYNSFINDLMSGGKSSSDIKEWFKRMTLRLSSFEIFLHHEYEVSSNILKKNNQLKQYLTNTETFNEQFKAPTVTLPTDVKTAVTEKYSSVSKATTLLVISLIKAEKKEQD